MKKALFFSLIIALSLASCKKDGPSQISFSLKNLTSLINENTDYIKKASPGVIYINNDTYLYFKMQNEITGISENYVYYNFEETKCNFIIVTPSVVNVLDDAKDLMTLAENEFGKAKKYYISYYDATETVQEEYFSTLDELWAFVSSSSLAVEDIETLSGMYLYNDYYIAAGGYYDTTDKYFMSIAQIGLYNDLSISSRPSDLSLNKSLKGFPVK